MKKEKRKYNTGIVIGRFQPFHKGHAYLIQKALKLCDKLIIGIGSSNISNKDNPFSYEKRLEMVEIFIENKKLQDRITKIVPIPDVFNDDKWFKITVENAGKFDASFGNNDWVNGIFRKNGVEIVEVPYYKRYLLEGTKIRELMRAGKKWQERVPSFLIKTIVGI